MDLTGAVIPAESLESPAGSTLAPSTRPNPESTRELKDHCCFMTEALQASENEKDAIRSQAQEARRSYKMNMRIVAERLSQADRDNKALLDQVGAWQRTCVALREDRNKWLRISQEHFDEILLLLNNAHNAEPPPSYNEFSDDWHHIATSAAASRLQDNVWIDCMQALDNARTESDLTISRAFRILACQCSLVQQQPEISSIAAVNTLLGLISFVLVSGVSASPSWNGDRDAILSLLRQIDETLLLLIQRNLHRLPCPGSDRDACCSWLDGSSHKNSALSASRKHILALEYCASYIALLRALAFEGYPAEIAQTFLWQSSCGVRSALDDRRMGGGLFGRVLSKLRERRDMTRLSSASRDAWSILKSSLTHAENP